MRGYLRFEFLLEPEDGLICLHVDVECAKNTFLLGVDVWNQLESFHVD